MHKSIGIPLTLCLGLLLPLGLRPARAQQVAAAAKSPVLTALEQELERGMAALKKADPAPYFIGYLVTEQQRAQVQGSNGALLESNESRARWLEAQVRVGDYQLDNTRKVGERQSFGGSPGTQIPIDDDVDVIRRAVWLETDAQYRAAAEALLRIKTSKEVKVETAEGEAPDFSREKPQVSYDATASFRVDRAPWEQLVRRVTREFHNTPAILNSIATFTATAENQYQATSEGTRLQFGQRRFRLELYVQSKAPDGMDINRYYNFDWVDPEGAPAEKEVLNQARVLIQEVEALRKAPLVEPFAGPVMLSGRAAAVFFHEVFGHRAEGHRQKDISEGQTFARKVGERILPEFISIHDDPTRPRMQDQVLLGHYPFDDEGVAAQRVTLVENGVLRGFLMSRSPLTGFPQSNGHGRRQVGFQPVSRQGNLIIRSGRTVTNVELRNKLIEEIKRQGKPFGLYIDDLEGGFTFTGRSLPQAFQLLPLIVYRVYADGRPDELVRGVDAASTPLVALTKIVATGDKPEVFNGFCGAESGSVPVAAVSPAILISEMEIQKKETSTDRPPILPHPAHDPLAKRSTAGAGGGR
jgi:predicted Zn-dependent protease